MLVVFTEEGWHLKAFIVPLCEARHAQDSFYYLYIMFQIFNVQKVCGG